MCRDKFEKAPKSNYVFKNFNGEILGKDRKTDKPTFKDFVKYLIRTPVTKYNDHWLPQWLHCHVCNPEVEFDIIGKMESVIEDSQQIFNISGLSQSDLVENQKLSATNIDTAKKKQSNVSDKFNLVQTYLDQLDTEDLLGLYEIYKPDFDLYDYDASKYIPNIT